MNTRSVGASRPLAVVALAATLAGLPGCAARLAKVGLKDLTSFEPAALKDLGLDQPEDARRARHGRPIRLYRVALSDLAKYRDDPATLLRAEHSLLYPVMVGCQVKSSMIVSHGGGKEKEREIESLGSPDLVRQAAARCDCDFAASPAWLSIVQVPDLHRLFVADERDGMRLTPLYDYPEVRGCNSQPDQSQPGASKPDQRAARCVFGELGKLAEKVLKPPQEQPYGVDPSARTYPPRVP